MQKESLHMSGISEPKRLNDHKGISFISLPQLFATYRASQYVSNLPNVAQSRVASDYKPMICSTKKGCINNEVSVGLAIRDNHSGISQNGGSKSKDYLNFQVLGKEEDITSQIQQPSSKAVTSKVQPIVFVKGNDIEGTETGKKLEIFEEKDCI